MLTVDSNEIAMTNKAENMCSLEYGEFGSVLNPDNMIAIFEQPS